MATPAALVVAVSGLGAPQLAENTTGTGRVTGTPLAVTVAVIERLP